MVIRYSIGIFYLFPVFSEVRIPEEGEEKRIEREDCCRCCREPNVM